MENKDLHEAYPPHPYQGKYMHSGNFIGYDSREEEKKKEEPELHSEDFIKKIQKSNHDQFNLIQKLKKD